MGIGIGLCSCADGQKRLLNTAHVERERTRRESRLAKTPRKKKMEREEKRKKRKKIFFLKLKSF